MSTDTKIVIRYSTVPLSSIILNYIDGMKAPDGEIFNADWWVDTAKNTVVIKAFIEVSDDANPTQS